MPKKPPKEHICVLSNKQLPQAEMVRFVCDDQSRVVPDIACKLPGEGVWLQACKDVVRQAVAEGVFEKHFGQCVVSPTLEKDVGAHLTKQALGSFSLARKMGKLVSGFTKVQQCLASQPVACLIQASDVAQGSKEKLRFNGSSVPVFDICNSMELAKVTKASRQMFMALLDSEDTQRLLPSVLKAQRYNLGGC
tara:strand:+ start:808 stop:1386 length:579 start_codon:yes stop_codon:yes gene_type:complete